MNISKYTNRLTLLCTTFFCVAIGMTIQVSPAAQAAPAIQTNLAPLTNTDIITTGGDHTCALTTSGSVKCWGDNRRGQLGDGSTTASRAPVDVVGISSIITAISAGGNHTCAVTSSGGVKCWGSNTKGQLGNGSTSDSTTPVDVSGLPNGVTAITAGLYHTCAVTIGGGVKCWGLNDHGQLGNGTTSNSVTPVNVSDLSNGVTDVAAGGYHTCALTDVGGVKCWGWNNHDQLGSYGISESATPVEVSGRSSDVSTIAVGYAHGCALLRDGGVKCWGWNNKGQLGNDTTNDSSTPVDVSGLSSDIIAITAGGRHSCAVINDPNGNSSVKCWGSNGSGRLGNGNSSHSNPELTPVDVVGLSTDITSIAAGREHTCVLTSGFNNASGVKCWGSNWQGQLGDGSIKFMTTPVDILALPSDVVAITSGNDYNCALTSTPSEDGGGAKCWGKNSLGQLGNGSTTRPIGAVDVSGLSTEVTHIAAGYSHSCAVTNNGGVKCWGSNVYGQLGDGSTSNSSTPVDVLGLISGVTTIATGDRHSCALTNGGGVKCWGWNDQGQLGNGTTSDPAIAVDVEGLSSGVIAIAVGHHYSCALTSGGGVKCWGSNFWGKLGNGSTGNSSVPVDVRGLTSGVTAISAGDDHACAVTDDGGVKCWGENQSGQLGNGSTGLYSSFPQDVVGLPSRVVSTSAGGNHSCALTDGGDVECWGRNNSGQLGNDSTNNSTTPVNVLGLSSDIVAITTGFKHTCALTGDGVKCWGENVTGQVNGFAGALISTIPVTVVDSNASSDMLGDVNCDNDITSVDALFILQYTVNLRTDSGGCPLPNENSLNANAGDANADGAITAVDALFILQCQVGISNAFCPAVTAASAMNAEEAAAAAQAKQMLVEQMLVEQMLVEQMLVEQRPWSEQGVNIFVPLITR